MAMILMLYRNRRSLDVSLWQDLREAGLDETVDEDPLPPAAAPPLMPHLTPAGIEPVQEEETSHA